MKLFTDLDGRKHYIDVHNVSALAECRAKVEDQDDLVDGVRVVVPGHWFVVKGPLEDVYLNLYEMEEPEDDNGDPGTTGP